MWSKPIVAGTMMVGFDEMLGFDTTSSTYAVPKPSATARNGSVVTALSSSASGDSTAVDGADPGTCWPAGLAGGATLMATVWLICAEGTLATTLCNRGSSSALTSAIRGLGLGGCQGGAGTPG